MLIEKKQVTGKLSLKQRVQLKMHTSLCDACKGYSFQSEIIEKGLQGHFDKEEAPELKLPSRAKDKILKNLKGQ
ncbi:MAG: hypothetical protein Roseis2KO_14920 [Roseivirga sp.]